VRDIQYLLNVCVTSAVQVCDIHFLSLVYDQRYLILQAFLSHLPLKNKHVCYHVETGFVGGGVLEVEGSERKAMNVIIKFIKKKRFAYVFYHGLIVI
jgi:hypothetical protein